MPFPSGYERKFGFEGFQDTHPSTPLPGTQVDVELDGVAKSTAALVAFLQKFTRADGKLANGSVGVDQLAADFKVGFKAPTTWEPGIMYVLADTVFEGTGFFTCIAPHTSGSSFESEYWSLILDFGSSAQAAAASAAVAQAAAAAAATVDGMFSAPVLSITGTPAGSPATGDRYLVAASGTTGVFVGKENQVALWSGAWVFSGAPKSGQILFNTGVGYAYKFDGTSWLKRRSKLAFVSDFATFSAALAFAAAASARLVVDDDRTLAANTSISANIPVVSFESGKLTLGAYDLTLDHPIRAEAEQIFDSTGTGKVKGTIHGPVCMDWWGTTSASTADAATTNAGNDCLDHVRQSDIPRNEVYCTKTVYYLNSSWILQGGKSSVGPKLNGNGATLLHTDVAANVAAIVWTGDSGSTSNGVIKNFRIRGNTVSWGIEVRAACWVHLDNIDFQDNETGLVLNNRDASTYTEFVTWSHCTFACNRAWFYRRVSGDQSFHGSGPLSKNVVNYVTTGVPAIRLSAGAIVYNAPFDCAFFVTDNSVPLIETAAGDPVTWMTYGNCTIENFAPSGTLLMIGGAGTISNATHTGVIQDWGGSFNLGPMVLMDSTFILDDGVVRGRQKGRIAVGNMGAGSATVTIGQGRSTNFAVEVFINVADYFWSGLISVGGDAFGNYDADLLATHTTGGSNYGTWGAPTPSWNGTVLTLTNAHYTAATGAVTAGVTDTGYTS